MFFIVKNYLKKDKQLLYFTFKQSVNQIKQYFKVFL